MFVLQGSDIYQSPYERQLYLDRSWFTWRVSVSIYPNDTVIKPKLDNRDSISVSVFFPFFHSAQTGSEVKPSKGNPLFSRVKPQKSEGDHLLQSNVEV
jgi:hypothetical protein